MRVVLLSVLNWDDPSGVRSVKTPFPADLVEEFVDFVRQNRQWPNAPEVLARRATRFLSALQKVGPLAQAPSGIPATIAVLPVEEVSKAVPCPHCDRTFKQAMHLARHLNAKHPVPEDVEA